MKKEFIFITVIFFFLSCSNHLEHKVVSFQEEDTVKALIQNKSNQIIWSKEIDPVTLSNPIPKISGVSKNVRINSTVASVVQNILEPVYPELEGFALLDTSKITSDLKSNLVSFCDFMCKDVLSVPETLFVDEYVFNLVFFIQNMKDLDLVKNYTRYVIGKAEESFDVIEIPVRFYSSEITLDLNIIFKRNEKYKIQQNPS